MMRNMSLRRAIEGRALLLTMVAVTVGLVACEAEVETEACLGGDGTCDLDPSSFAASSSSVTVGAGGGGGGAVCLEGCDAMSVSGNSGEFPADVDAALDNCRRCHTTPLASGAPFPLDTYAESQELYFETAIWALMVNAVRDPPLGIGFMPLTDPDLTADEETALIDKWACLCAPPDGG